MIIVDCEQGTPEWKETKAGVISASNLHNIVTGSKGDYSKSADKYMIKLISEKLTGEVDETYSNAAMERGIIMEEEARNWYSIDHQTEQVGFIFKDERKLIGCSPDGFNQAVEIKCVIGSTMVNYLLADNTDYIVNQYKQQLQGSMYVTDLKEWDLLIYHPSFDPILITVPRDDEYIRQIEMAVARFLKEMNEKIERLTK